MSRERRIAEYRGHLGSEQWEAIRQAANDRAGGRCEHCGAPVSEFHHVRYPKQFKNDEAHNVVAVCRRCHDLHHGVRDMTVAGELDAFEHNGIVVYQWLDDDVMHYSFVHVYAIAHKVDLEELKRPLHQNSIRQKFHSLPPQWCRLSDYPQSNFPWLVGKEGVQGALARFDTPEGNAFLVALVKKWNESTQPMSVGDALIATGQKLNDHEQRITALEQRPNTTLELPKPETSSVLVRCRFHSIGITQSERAIIGRECRRIMLRDGGNPDECPQVAGGAEPGRVWPIAIIDEALRNKGVL